MQYLRKTWPHTEIHAQTDRQTHTHTHTHTHTLNKFHIHRLSDTLETQLESFGALFPSLLPLRV